MKAKKTVMTALVTILAGAMLLTGCSQKGDSNSNESQESSQPAATATPDKTAEAQTPEAQKLEPYTLKMFIPGTGTPEDLQLVNDAITEYLKDKINVKFELNVIDWGSWADKMNLKFASGEPFDLVRTNGADNFVTKIQNGSIIDMTDLIDKYAADAKEVIDPALLEGSMIDGKHYSLPVNKELGSLRGILLRKDLVDKYNIDITKIKKLEDMEPIYDMIKEKEPNVTPLYMDKSTTVVATLSIRDFDGSTLRGTPGYDLVDRYETPQYRSELDLARKWYLAGYVNKDAATLKDLPSGLKAGKAFSYLEWLKPGKDAEVSNATGYPWVQVELTKPLIATTDTTGAMMSISRTSKNPERATMFLNLLYTDKTLVNMLAFGIEGKHYVKVPGKDNIIDFPPGVTAQTSGYNLNSAYMFGNQFLDYLWANENPNKWEEFKKFNEEAETSKFLGYISNTDSVKNEVAALSNVDKEFGPGLNTGTVDPVEILPKYLEKRKSVGAEKVSAEGRKQLEEWLKTKQK